MIVKPRESTDYRLWAARVLGWDGLLPAVISGLSMAIARLFPNNRPLAEILMVSLPIIGFFVRFAIGSRQISGNYCGSIVRGVQYGALGMAMLMFLFVDFLVVLSAFIPRNQPGNPPQEMSIWAAVLAIYICLVALAMYPGRRPADPVWRELE